MPRTRILPAVLVVGAFTVASLFAAAPASAATLPSGQKITVVDYTNNWQFYDASPADAALTPVGIGDMTPEDEYVTAVDVDDDGQGFAFSTTFEADGPEDDEEPDDVYYPNSSPVGAALFTADAVTGKLSNGMKMSILVGPEGEQTEYTADECTGIDYTAGKVLGVCYSYGETSVGFIGWVDTENAVLEAITSTYAGGGIGFLHFSALALDPITGELWAFEDFYWESYLIPLDGDEPEYQSELDLPALGADFDRSGQLWITTYANIAARAIEPGDAGLATLDPNTGVNPFTAAWPDDEFYSEAITIWGHPSLPATGPAESSGVVIGAAAFLLLGAILAAGATARRRSAEQ